MLNSILFCLLLASIGGCYVWLGAKKKDRAEQILGLHREIELIQKQIKEKDQQISWKLSLDDLRVRAARAGLGLKPIDIGPKGRLIRLPEPIVSQEAALNLPALAGNLQP